MYSFWAGVAVGMIGTLFAVCVALGFAMLGPDDH